MKLISKILHNEITKQLPTYLNIHRTYSNLPINIWIPTIEQYSNNFCITLNNSNKVNPLTDRDLLIFNNLDNFYMYYTLKLKRTDILSNLNSY